MTYKHLLPEVKTGNSTKLNKMPTKERQMAMAWWNELDSLRKTQICDTNTEVVGKVRRHESLTGREIEMLWRIEVKF